MVMAQVAGRRAIVRAELPRTFIRLHGIRLLSLSALAVALWAARQTEASGSPA